MKYLQIPDIRDTKTWANPNAARLYLYMAMTAASQGGGYKYSRRWTCQKLDISESAYRHALKVIEGDGLIRTQRPKKGPREEPNLEPSPPPHITIVSVKELYGTNDPGSDPKSDPKSDPGSDPNIKKIINKKYNLTLARAKAVTLIDSVADYIHVGRSEAKVAVKAYLDTMAHKSKVWEDEHDMQAHLMDWCLRCWTGSKSRAEAASKGEARQEREQQRQQQQQPRKTEAEEQREVTQWLTGALRSETLRGILDGKVKAGWLWDDKVRARVVRALDETDGLREHLTEALGYDILRQQALHM